MTTNKLRAYWQKNPAQAGRCPTCGDFVSTEGECINQCGEPYTMFPDLEPEPEPQDINCIFATGEIEINTNCGSVKL